MLLLIKVQQSPTATLIPLFSNSELTGCRYPGLLDRKKSFGHVPPMGVEPSTSCVQGDHPIYLARLSVTERRQWRPPYQTGKTVHVHANHYKHNEDGRLAPGVRGTGSVQLSHSWKVVTKIGTHTHTKHSISGVNINCEVLFFT